MRGSLEITVYPFQEGEQAPAHVEATMGALRNAGLQVDLEAFAVVARGDMAALVGALPRVIDAALAAGATKVALSLEVDRVG
jgi:uncharacterized protein YqgV (UPF0045/DUF77 family)